MLHRTGRLGRPAVVWPLGHGIRRSFSVKSGTALFYYGPAVCLVLCNVVCLALTLKKVQYLTRGNSVLRREEQRNRLAAENDCAAGDAEGGDARRRNGGGGRAAVDAKT
ncbi:Protein of unknown function [Gryllus bimaculatus]|nr:Protein of unknown function [Gryllus bimaculatus]